MDNRIRKLFARVLNNDNTVMHQVCKFANTDTLFLVTFPEPILFFWQNNEKRNDSNYDLNEPFLQKCIVYFTVLYMYDVPVV